ncbi:uncharacterized protein LOC111117896 isoform X1 [Crassostrea virginica]
MNLALLSIVISAASACLSSGDVDRCDDERQFFTTPNLMTRMLVLRRLTTRSDFREFPLLHRLTIFTSELNCDDVHVNPWVTVRLNGVTCKNTQPSITTRLFTTMATTVVNGTTTTAMIVFVLYKTLFIFKLLPRQPHQPDHQARHEVPPPHHDVPPPHHDVPPPQQPQVLRRSNRQRRPPNRLTF